MPYRWKDDPWWSEAPGRPFRLAALGAAVGLPAILFAALVRNAVVSPTTPAKPVDLVVKRMNSDPDAEARRAAIRELWQGEHKDQVLGALHSAPPSVRVDVADFLVEQGAEVVPELLAMLYDSRVRPSAVRVIVRIGPAAVPRVVGELPKSADEMTTILIGVLGEIGPAGAAEAVPAVRQMLRAGDASARTTAGDVLGRLGPTAVAAIPDLISALNDSDTGVRLQCMQTIGGFGAASDPAVPAIAKSLRDPLVTNAVAAALGKIGGSAIEPLAAALDDPAPEVRLAATQALGAIGPAAAKAADRLARLSKEDVDLRVRRAAMNALGATK